MNGTPRHTHHKHQPRPSQRRRLRRRQKITVIFSVVGVTLLVLATVILIVGAKMHKKSVALRNTEPTEDTRTEVPETPSTPSVVAYPLSANSPYDSLAALAEQGHTAASLALNSSDGILRYSKDTLSLIAKDADDKGIYLSGVFYLSALSEADELTRYKQLSSQCASVAEALGAGFDEVMLLPPAISDSSLEELTDFLDDLRRLVPDATVGLALPQGYLGEEHAETVDALSKEFSLLALDLSKAEDVDASVEADLYYLLRYSMRVLLPSGDTKSLYEAVTSHGVSNLQFF